MDFRGQEVTDFAVNDANTEMTVTYADGNVEKLVKGPDTYARMNKDWLVSPEDGGSGQPPFISDIFKVQMRDITLATINNDPKCLSNLDDFFTNANKSEVMRFLTYMRKRDLTEEKSKWTVRS
jgi:hypothetical protein